MEPREYFFSKLIFYPSIVSFNKRLTGLVIMKLLTKVAEVVSKTNQ